MVDIYARAYTEVLEILKYLPNSEVSKIPQEEINFLKKYSDKTYNYKYNLELSIENQHISRKAKTILLIYFKKYFANEKQQIILTNILNNNYKINLRKKSERYNENIFEKVEKTKENTEVIVYKKNIIIRIVDKIKRFFIKKI